MIPILREADTDRAKIFAREDPVDSVAEPVRAILADVKANGDAALKKYTQEFDGVEISTVEVGAGALEEGFRAADPTLVDILYRAAERIAAFHQHQVRNSFLVNDEEGILMGQKVVPLARVGLYVPGGTAAYPSSVLMNAIPAKLAGVKELCMVTPPGKDGKIPPNILAAARVCGVDRVFRVGGAQAVAALAYGTESVPKVDKIVGPGNQFVAEAKKQVFGQVGIDMVAGPSEVLVVADSSARPHWLAADMLSQAEHDMLASAILLTDDITLAEQVQQELEKQCSQLPKAQIAGKSLMDWGAIVVVPNIMTAVAIANRVAPEHLELCVRDPWALLPHIRHAGAIFMGQHSPEPVGDYFAGPNHVLPTLRTARFSSALSVQNFCKKTSIVATSPAFLLENAPAIASLARLEGLEAHARSVEIRSKR